MVFEYIIFLIDALSYIHAHTHTHLLPHTHHNHTRITISSIGLTNII